MKKYVTRQHAITLARIAILCALAFLSVSFPPGFATVLSRGVEVGAALSAVRSVFGSICAINPFNRPIPVIQEFGRRIV